jgi:FtsP/CotA-like multicopper oxidase with cupredoxin domain
LHFHGLVIAPTCHQDDTLNTAVRPSESYAYKFKIPQDQPPGVYWYHPHIHGFTKAQVLGGASGALIVEGIESRNPEIRGLPERVFVVRDQDLLNPDADPISIDGLPPPMVFKDADGDVMNTGTGTGKPAKDLSINFVSVPFPEYKPAIIRMKPSEKQFWRVLNASAITYVDIQVLYDERPQPLGLVAIDGVSLNHEGAQQIDKWRSHILLPPAGRAEFTVTGPAAGAHASLVTRSVDTGPVGDNDPVRPLAAIQVDANAPEPRSTLSNAEPQPAVSNYVPLRQVKPLRQRLLYFSERPQNPSDPNSPIMFFVTVDGQTPRQFDHNSTLPNITVHAGDVEDWIIENRSKELHAFHIHQIHFQLMEWNSVPISEPFLRDTVNVPYWREKMMTYPSVKLRMDFRDPNIVGTFAYHCHLLEHQDGGMMGLIRVEPKVSGSTSGRTVAQKISSKSKARSSN